MKQVARFRRHDFGNAVAEALRARKMSIRDFTSAHPWISVSAVSRAMNGKPLATENMLALCAELGIDPFEHFSVENQTVSAPVSRETVPGEGPRNGSDGRSALRASPDGIGGILDGLREGT